MLALLLALGLGGFFAVRALDEGARKELACTQIGCTSGIGVQFPGLRRAIPRAWDVQVCAGADCVRWKAMHSDLTWVSTAWRGVPKRPEATYTADVQVLDRRGRVLLHLRRAVRLRKWTPNGPDCPPTCYSATLALDAAHGRLEPVRS